MRGNAGDGEGESGTGRVVSGRYRLLEPLGHGAAGIVWRARDEVLARDVAVREVRAPAGLDPAEVQRVYRRLEREAWAAARVSHRGVAGVHDVASEDGRPWVVMELVRGLSLADVLAAEGPMPPRGAAYIGEQVLAALRSAHDAGVLHRDVRPATVLLANDGRVVLRDLGIAGLPGPSSVILAGEVAGSPEFTAPERVLGHEPGPGCDLWSLGVVLYAAVEGVSPFRRATPADTLRAVVEEEAPPPRRAGALAPLLEGLLRKDPADRPAPAEAARMLRLVGAGGAVRSSGGPGSGPEVAAPAGPARSRREPQDDRPGASGPAGAAAPAGPPEPRAGDAGARREGRAGLVLGAGIAVLLLALAALGWLLLRDGGSGGSEGRRPARVEGVVAGAGSSPTRP
ncbi:serine/threonine-protein kinase [Streptomyces sp. NPDC058655]|uniref:serine/threonine-protein kinase n=1 Tax=Streptomyces sp. NPDC058655 TaxID=3346577 RepID=UPI00364E4A35